MPGSGIYRIRALEILGRRLSGAGHRKVRYRLEEDRNGQNRVKKDSKLQSRG